MTSSGLSDTHWATVISPLLQPPPAAFLSSASANLTFSLQAAFIFSETKTQPADRPAAGPLSLTHSFIMAESHSFTKCLTVLCSIALSLMVWRKHKILFKYCELKMGNLINSLINIYNQTHDKLFEQIHCFILSLVKLCKSWGVKLLFFKVEYAHSFGLDLKQI